jgi:glycosidase
LLFCSPGIPSLYYGSEFGIIGQRNEQSDYELRPEWNDDWAESELSQNLFKELCRFSKIRKESEALKYGNYEELLVNYNQIFAFLRESKNEKIIIIVNAKSINNECIIENEQIGNGRWKDLLSNEEYIANNNILKLQIEPSWLKILRKI